MDKSTSLILDSITEGVVVLDDEMNVLHWNKYMVGLVGLNKNEVENKNIFEIFDKLDKPFYRQIFDKAIKKGNQYFFSSKIHKNVIVENREINFKINRIEKSGKKNMIIEFADVTNEFIRVRQLRETVKKLSALNKELKEKEQEISKLAYKDNLTNLSNRALFYSYAEKMIASAQRNGTILGVVFIDIDKFKSINDTYGHQVGDQALIETANLLARNTRRADMVFRFGGDEFIILLTDLKDEKSHKEVLSRIVRESKRIRVNDGIEIAFSIGVSLYPKDGTNIEILVQKADKAMYDYKRDPKNGMIHLTE